MVVSGEERGGWWSDREVNRSANLKDTCFTCEA